MKVTILLTAVLIFVQGSLFAQNGNQQGWGRGSGYNRMYDPKTIVKAEGVVTEVQNYAPAGSSRNGIHIKLKTASKTMDVHLGPSWYIDKQDMKIRVQDKVSVRGSEVTFNGEKVIIASEVEKGGKVLKLRNTDGTPVWAGRGRR